MDATTIAALAVAIHESHAAAIEQLLLDRERVAMAGEDTRSRLVDVLQAHQAPQQRQNADALACALCRRQLQALGTFQMAPRGRWADLPPAMRVLCTACFSMQTSQYQG